jgi:hypothetical protein
VGTDEYQILEFMKTKTEFVTPREVSRRIGRRRCEKDPTWAKPALIRLTNAGHLIMNDRGHFCFKPPEERIKKPKERIHVSPQIAALLAASGKGGALTQQVHNIGEEEI